MTEQQIDRERLRKLTDAATDGPWMFDRDRRDGWMVVFGGNEYPHGYSIIGSNEYLEPADAEFIAAAREAIPALLDQLDQAEAELDSWMTRAYEAEGKLWKAEARIKAVQDVLSKHESILGDNLGVPVERIRRALESVPPPGQ